MAGEGADASDFRLGKKWIVGETVFLEQRFERAFAATEAESIHAQHRDVRVDVETFVARGLVAAVHCFAHEDPEGVAGGDAVAAGEHELIAIRMFGAANNRSADRRIRGRPNARRCCRACRRAVRRSGRSGRNCRARTSVMAVRKPMSSRRS